MNRKTKILLFIIFLVCVSVLGITYAYFVTKLSENDSNKTVEISGGKLELSYSDGNGEIVVEKMIPGNIVETKTFTVKNTGKNDIYDYDVYIDTVTNQLLYFEDLTYILTCKEYDQNDNFIKNCTGIINDVFPQDDKKIVTNSISVGYVHKYELTITYHDTYLDQSDDMGKSIKGRIGIYDDTKTTSN